MAAIPRPASTVILMNDASHIYMTKRPETMKFLGGYYVFPGGALEKSDYKVENGLLKGNADKHSFPFAHFIGAARELFEEIGVFLGLNSDGTPVKFPKEKAWMYRRQLLNGEISFPEIFKKEKLYFPCDSLQYFGHFITPKESPIRYDTRFFVAKLPEGQTPLPYENEIAEAFWINPKDALDAYRQNKMSMVTPTILSLKKLTGKIQF